MKVAPIAGFVVLEGPACANTGAGRTSPRTSFNGRTNADRLRDFRNDRREEDKRGTPSRVWCLIQSAATFIVNGFAIRNLRLPMRFLSGFRLMAKKGGACPTQRGLCWLGSTIVICLLFAPSAIAQLPDLELSRPARPWEFLCATGTRTGLFGNESGNFEAWVYPLKLFRNFHVGFRTDGRSLPAESLVRTVSVRPESSTIIYAGDTFSVRETLFVPVHDAGAVIKFEVETSHP